MKNRRNYYRILHVQPDAPTAIIKSSYRTLMQKLRAHPDLGGDGQNAALINEAFSVLTDPARRARYDTDLNLRSRQRCADPNPHVRQPKAPPPKAEGYTQKPCPFCQMPPPPAGHYASPDVCTRCGSPLTPPLRVELEGSCQRAVSRIARDGAVAIFTDWPQPRPYPGFIIDISPKGCRIGSPLALSVGELIKLEGNLLCAVARVVSCLENTPGNGPDFHLGTEFLTLAFAQMRGTFVSKRI